MSVYTLVIADIIFPPGKGKDVLKNPPAQTTTTAQPGSPSPEPPPASNLSIYIALFAFVAAAALVVIFLKNRRPGRDRDSA